MEEKRTPQRRPRQTQAASAAPANPPRRRRRQRKPPVKALAICAGIIFLVGFLLGFLVRGFFLPEPQTQEAQSSQTGQQSPLPSESDPPPVQNDPPKPAPDWRLILVSSDSPLEAGYSVELTKLSGGMAVDKRCYSDLQNLLSACKEAGFSPTIVSAYVSPEEQQTRYDEVLEQLQAENVDNPAEALAGVVALPGQSEHQTGLAVDIVNANNQNLDESQRSAAITLWLAENAWRYGFIQRYPESAAEETGVAFAPWHYRYVGTEAAAAMHELGLTLEGYLIALGS